MLITFFAVFIFIVGMKIVDVNANKTTSTSMKREYISIEVEAGDSLYNIAERYIGVGYSNLDDYIDDIKAVNDIKEDTVYVGKNIIVPRYVVMEN